MMGFQVSIFRPGNPSTLAALANPPGALFCGRRLTAAYAPVETRFNSKVPAKHITNATG